MSQLEGFEMKAWVSYLLLIASIVTPFGRAFSAGSNSSPNAAVNEILDCSTIRIAEEIYILQNIDRTPRDRKIRSWIITRIEHQLHMMETVHLSNKQREFIRRIK